jgi:hypothetical protein
MSDKKYDVIRMRSDLKKMIGTDGFTKVHLTAPDSQLISDFVYIYGEDELKEYLIKDKKTVKFSVEFNMITSLSSRQIRDHIGNFLNQIQDETEVVFNPDDTDKADNLQYDVIVSDYGIKK